jgi:hypothetical protein
MEAKPVFWSPGAVQAEAKVLLKAKYFEILFARNLKVFGI